MLDRVRWIDALRDNPDLGPQTKLVAVMLVSRSNENGESWPSMARLARDCSLSQSTCRKALAELTERGVVRAERRLDDGGRDLSTLYRITLAVSR
jgi:DNA-binding transcriptional MocR family regulator